MYILLYKKRQKATPIIVKELCFHAFHDKGISLLFIVHCYYYYYY